MTYDRTDLYHYYTLNTTWVRQGLFSLQEIDSMLPYERQIYIDMIQLQIEKEREAIERAKGQNKGN